MGADTSCALESAAVTPTPEPKYGEGGGAATPLGPSSKLEESEDRAEGGGGGIISSSPAI